MGVTLAVAAALYLLHQDLWFWRVPTPLVLGFLPIGLFYHAAYTLVVSLALAWLVPTYWPAHLEDAHDDGAETGATRRHRQ